MHTPYRIECPACATHFDAAAAAWCGCDGGLRSPLCPICRSCLCRTPAAFKRRFWTAAPDTLREDPRRFSAQSTGSTLLLLDAVPALENAPLVLVVDDEEGVRSMIASFTSHLGYRVMTSDDPQHAYFTAQQHRPRAVVTDALMPGMDGRELCRRLKDSPIGGGLKVILMTSLYTARRYRTEATNVFRADDYLIKPVPFSTLAGVLARLVPLPD
jgi:CheY-like chemotaxis protein